jgi:hypothetical protein
MEAKISFLQFPQVLPASVTVEQHEIYKYFALCRSAKSKGGPIFQEVYDIYTVWNSETLFED